MLLLLLLSFLLLPVILCLFPWKCRVVSTSLHYVSGEDFYWTLGGMKVLNEKIKKDKNEKQTQNYKQQQKQQLIIITTTQCHFKYLFTYAVWCWLHLVTSCCFVNILMTFTALKKERFFFNHEPSKLNVSSLTPRVLQTGPESSVQYQEEKWVLKTTECSNGSTKSAIFTQTNLTNCPFKFPSFGNICIVCPVLFESAQNWTTQRFTIVKKLNILKQIVSKKIMTRPAIESNR